jgi:hypothetical protein
MDGTIGELFLLVKAMFGNYLSYYASKSSDWRSDWERDVEWRGSGSTGEKLAPTTFFIDKKKRSVCRKICLIIGGVQERTA